MKYPLNSWKDTIVHKPTCQESLAEFGVQFYSFFSNSKIQNFMQPTLWCVNFGTKLF